MSDHNSTIRQKMSGAKTTRKADTAIVVASGKVWVYEAIDPNTKQAYYVGRTNDLHRRALEHDRKSDACKMLRRFLELKDFKFADTVRVIPELAGGVPASRAWAFEGWAITNRNTLHDPLRNPLACNAKHGDRIHELDYDAVTKEIHEGIKWPVPQVPEPPDLVEARCEAAVLEDLSTIAEEMELPEAEQLKVIAESAEAKVHQMVVSWHATRLKPLQMAEKLALGYQALGVDAVDKEKLTSDLNQLKAEMQICEEDEELISMVNGILLVAKPQREAPVSSKATAAFLTGIAELLVTAEEARLEWTTIKSVALGERQTVKENIYKVRAYSMQHDKKKPRANGGDAEETSLGLFLSHWKTDNSDYGGCCTDLASCQFLMRDFQWFDACVNRKDKVTQALKTQLEEGKGWEGDPGRKDKIGCDKANRAVYHKMMNLMRGTGNEEEVDHILSGLSGERKHFYKTAWEDNREAFLQRYEETSAKNKRKREEAKEADKGGPSGV